MAPIITLLTDFGTVDGYVGAMKGVILSRAPEARLVDLTHDVPAQDVRAGARALAEAAPCFPPGTIHLAVVDPGVGSSRGALLMQYKEQFFIGPDNGLLGGAAPEPAAAWALDREDYFHQPVSATFHGRDVFASVAGHLAAGVSPENLGRVITTWVKLEQPMARAVERRVTGCVVHIDHFGNLVTNIDRKLLDGEEGWTVELRGRRIDRIHATYSDVSVGHWVAYFGSGGALELAIRDGRAAAQGYTIDSEVTLCK